MLWERKCSIVIANQNEGIDVSKFAASFSVKQTTSSNPTSAYLKVFNLSADSIRKIKPTILSIQAGYEEQYGTIFSGDILQINPGRDNATDTYIEIVAGEGMLAYAHATVSTTIEAPHKLRDIYGKCLDSLRQWGVNEGTKPEFPDHDMIRARVLYGSTRGFLDEIAAQTGYDWSISQGVINWAKQGSPVADRGKAILVNSKTGLIGNPKQTMDGIVMTTLLNPNIKGKPGQSIIQLDNKTVVNQFPIPVGYGSQRFLADAKDPSKGTNLPSIAEDGLYEVWSASHSGNTRGNEWYTHILATAVGAKYMPLSPLIYRI